MRSEEADRRNEASQKRIEDLLDEMGRLRSAAAAVPAVVATPAHGPVLDAETQAAAAAVTAVAARTDKISKMGIQLGKSSKIREFKDSFDGNVKE